MKQKKISLRTCVVTKEKMPKNDLLRIVRTPEGLIEADLTGKKNGRGAYLKKDIDVFAKAKKSGILNRILEVEVSDEIFNELNELVK